MGETSLGVTLFVRGRVAEMESGLAWTNEGIYSANAKSPVVDGDPSSGQIGTLELRVFGRS